jgi:hypothetical protein
MKIKENLSVLIQVIAAFSLVATLIFCIKLVDDYDTGKEVINTTLEETIKDYPMFNMSGNGKILRIFKQDGVYSIVTHDKDINAITVYEYNTFNKKFKNTFSILEN